MSQGQSGWGGWFEKATSHAKEMAGQAQAAAAELSKQAAELQRTYNAEVMTSMLYAEGNKKPDMDLEVERRPRTDISVDDIDFTYVTENLIGMGFPFSPEKRKSKRGNDIRDVSDYLNSKHNGHYMIWNISEDVYNYSYFSDQVLEYKFPGHPAPPLGLMFKICTSVESWLDADDRNIAVVHCLTGKGRTAVVLACVLTWMGEFSSPMEALSYVSVRKGSHVDSLTIPSQRRYIQYFSNVLDGVRPRAEPLLLRRVIMNGIPRYGDHQTEQNQDADTSGCSPYLQLFKNGRIIANAVLADVPTDTPLATSRNESTWVRCSTGSVSFQVDCIVQGDLLLRCRHFDKESGARISMFRTAFHTGYVPSGVLRLTKAQLDGPNSDARYGDDFFIDLIFAPVEKPSGGGDNAAATGSNLSDSGVVMDSALTDKFEVMLHRDTRFWESVVARKARAKRRRPRKFVSESVEKFSIFDEAGPNSGGSRGGSGRGGGNDDFEDEVSFSVKPTGGAGLGGISDDELIRQLAEAEADEDSSCSAGVGTGGEKIVGTLGEVLLSEGESDRSMSDSEKRTWRVSAPTVAPVAAVAGVAAAPSSASRELDALEELERELGLDLGSVTSQKKSDGGSAAVPATSGGADDLDDLEAFLESLNTGASGS